MQCDAFSEDMISFSWISYLLDFIDEVDAVHNFREEQN